MAENEFQKGLDAFESEDYETALKVWLPLAEQGNTKAQFQMGLMYHQGQGVPQDHQEAIKWYRLAEEQRHPDEQHNLGMMDKCYDLSQIHTKLSISNDGSLNQNNFL